MQFHDSPFSTLPLVMQTHQLQVWATDDGSFQLVSVSVWVWVSVCPQYHDNTSSKLLDRVYGGSSVHSGSSSTAAFTLHEICQKLFPVSSFLSSTFSRLIPNQSANKF